MSFDILSLFPFLSLIILSVLFIVFISWNKLKSRLPKKPVNHATPKDPKPMAPPDKVSENFANYMPVPSSNRAVNFPNYNGALIRFNTRTLNPVYEDYATNELYASPALQEKLSTLPISDETLPDYGAAIGTFDAGVASIPWDYDNKSYRPSDVMWGIVSRNASLSIFMKNYHRELLSDSSALVEGNSGIMYFSPILQIATDDPVTSTALTVFDGVVAEVGGQLLPDREKIFEKIQHKIEKQQFKAGIFTEANKGRYNKFLANEANKARAAKVLKGELLTAAEIAEQSKYEIQAMKGAEEAQGKISLFGKIGKRLQKIGVVSKIMAGFREAKKFVTKSIALMKNILTRALNKVLEKMGLLTGITILINLMAVALDAAAIATFGGLAPLAVAFHIIQVAWDILDAICMVLMLALQIILPALLDKSMSNGALCTSGKPLDQVISDPTLYFIFTTFIPIGGVLDAFGPYLCYNDDGSAHMKSPLYVPEYYSDATLSLYKHVYPPEEVPRGDSTSYTDASNSVPPGWSLVAGIMREDCCCGTWTSSPVDALCNIASYVPVTRTKASSVPRTYAKASSVPATRAKRTDPLIKVKGTPQWRDPHVMTLTACPAGTNDDGVSCWGCA